MSYICVWYWMSLSRFWSLVNILCMIRLDSLNAGGKGWTKYPSVTFFILFLLSHNVNLSEIFLLTYLFCHIYWTQRSSWGFWNIYQWDCVHFDFIRKAKLWVKNLFQILEFSEILMCQVFGPKMNEIWVNFSISSSLGLKLPEAWPELKSCASKFHGRF